MKYLLISVLVTGFALSEPAHSFSFGGGNSADAPGQEKARANCFSKALNNTPRGKKGKKEGLNVTNCDHFFNDNNTGPGAAN